ncbi:non-homologous end-joining DNA ligase [Streptomyces olivaceiscleroticus]
MGGSGGAGATSSAKGANDAEGGAKGSRKRAGGAATEIEAGGRTVRLSHPDKVYFPERGFTKLDVAQYYLAVGDGIVRALHDRPTTLERYPDGVTGESFFQKRAPKNKPDWLPTAHITFPSGRSADEICPTELAAVLWAANLGCLTFHPWPVRRDRPDHPDELRIDLDPQPGTDYADAVRAAHELHALLDELGLRGWPKTSGGRGLHVYVPIEPRWTFTEVRRAAITLGRELARRMPDQVTTAWWKEERGTRVFVDYNQMARDRTIASAYSVRPRPQATVSAPLRWDELDDAEPLDFDLATMPARYAERGDVHADMADHAFGLEPVFALAERDAELGDLPYPPDHPKMPGEPTRVQPSRARH